jgi:ribosomal protein S18 acetylase RimI-like enzyme
MQTGVLVRPARPEDIDAMAKLISLVFLLEEDFAADPDKQRQGLKLFFENPARRCLLVAEYRQQVIGMCSAQLLVSTAEGGWKAIVEDVVVGEDFRSKGIAKKLLGTLEEWASSNGVKRLDLLADRDNIKALDFYYNQQWKTTNLIALQKKEA